MQLYYIRHGQSINNANVENKDYQEHSDPFLTEKGKQQAQTLAQFLKENQTITNTESWNIQNEFGFGITHIYCSLMERAAETAAYTARALNVPFSAWADIHEEGGIYTREKDNRFQGLPGKPRSFFEQNFPELELPDSFDESDWWNRSFEDMDERQARADKVLAELLEKHGDKEGQPEQKIIFVSHGGFFMRFMCAVLKLPWRQASHNLYSWFLLNNCSISRFDFDKERVLISYVNKVDHLPADLITA